MYLFLLLISFAYTQLNAQKCLMHAAELPMYAVENTQNQFNTKV